MTPVCLSVCLFAYVYVYAAMANKIGISLYRMHIYAASIPSTWFSSQNLTDLRVDVWSGIAFLYSQAAHTGDSPLKMFVFGSVSFYLASLSRSLCDYRLAATYSMFIRISRRRLSVRCTQAEVTSSVCCLSHSVSVQAMNVSYRSWKQQTLKPVKSYHY